MWSKQQKTQFASSFFSVLKYSQLNSKSIKYNPKKFHSSSIDKKMPQVSKLAKSMIQREKRPKFKPDTHTENNTIDINISVNYHKNAQLLRNQEHLANSLYKAPIKKISSYSMNPSSHKRNSSEVSESNIIHNNLNISLTNIASPKTNNSFIVNPIIFQHKTLDDDTVKKGKEKTGKVSSAKNLKEYSLNCNDVKIENQNSISNKELIKAIEEKSKITLLTQTINAEIKESENVENDLNKLNNKKYDILRKGLIQYSTLVDNNHQNFLNNFLNHLNEIVNFKNDQINELVKGKFIINYI